MARARNPYDQTPITAGTMGGGGTSGTSAGYSPQLPEGRAALVQRRPAPTAPAAAPAGGGRGGAAMPSFPAGGGGAGAASGQPSAPPEIRDLEIKAETDPRLTAYANRYETNLSNVEGGKTREADIMRGQLESDAERQIASAKESALAAGRPWTAEDESRMRSELSRGKYAAQAQFELGSQRQTTEALQGGLGIEQAPFQSQLAEKGFSQGTQKMLMDYALGRGGLVSEDKKTAVMEAGQAIDAYKAYLSMLGGGGAFNFSSSFS